MKKQVIENFNEWIFEAAAPKKPAPPKKSEAPVIPDGYKKTTLPEGSKGTNTDFTDGEVLKAKGWKALANTDTLTVKKGQIGQQVEVSGFASNNGKDFNEKSGGVLVMGPSIYKGEKAIVRNTSFIVGFPYKHESMEGDNTPENNKNIILSEKYVLFTPWEKGEANADKNWAMYPQPYGFRLIPTDKLTQIGMQSLLWIIGYNNSDVAKKAMLKLTKKDVIDDLKEGLTYLAKSSTIKGANKSGKIIFDGYNSLVSSPNAYTIIFENFVDGHPEVNMDYLKKNLPLKTA